MDEKDKKADPENEGTKKENHAWQPELDEIKLRHYFAEQMGGPEGVKRQHANGKLTARERIDFLLDPGSFQEIGAFTGNAEYDENGKLIRVTPSSIVIGKGRIDGKKVVVVAEDFTIRAGSSEAASPEKMVFAEQLAMDLRVPLVRLVDAVGGSIRIVEKQQSTKIPGYDRWPLTLGLIPVVGVALGPCAGLGAVRVVASHFSIMVNEISQVFAAGPQVVNPGIHEKVTKDELGGPQVHTKVSGVVDNEAKDEPDALRQVARFLSYLPSNVYQVPPRVGTGDGPGLIEDILASIVPRNRRHPYDMRKILDLVFDRGSLFEIGRGFGASQITMFGRINGYPVGILANDTKIYGGAMTASACEKIIRFVDMCDTFHIPVVNFFDQPGVAIGSAAESQGTIRKAVRVQLTIGQATVPWCTFLIRRAFGVAGAAYEPRHSRASIRYAWPSAYWGSIPVEGGVEAAYKKEILNAENPLERRNELVEYYRRFESPFRTAERFKVEEIIDPRRTRPILCDWIEEAYALVPQLLGVTTRTMRM